MKKKLSILMLIFLMDLSTSALATDYPGIGVICCGDLWESFMPSGINKFYNESRTNVTKNSLIIRMGNYERQWNTPTFHYPAGDIFTLTWNNNLMLTEYSPTEQIGAYRKEIASDTSNYRNYCNAFWMASLGNSTKVPTSNGDSHGGAPWLNNDRTQQVYEFFMPTNIGVDIKGRIRGFSMNEANMNDFIAMEFELNNTGVQDNNCDGVIDRQNHKIEALSMLFSDETFGSMRISTSGGRWSWGSWAPTRLSGYDGSPDLEGNPWDVPACWATGITEWDLDANRWAADGIRKVAYRSSLGIFSDIWNGQHFIAVKKGPMTGGSTAPDKPTIYGSHPIGEGAQRGWYVTRNRTKIGEPYGNFVMATGVFYDEGGKTEDPALLRGKVLKPDPNYFDTSQPYIVGNPVSFAALPKKSGQPMGDLKYTNFFFENWEKNFPGTPEPKIPAADVWTNGGTPRTIYNFDSGASVGVGPFSLEVGETITIVAIEYGGYRLKGVRNAVKAARYAYQNNWNVPVPPRMPEMKVSAAAYTEPGAQTATVKPLIVWDKRAEVATDFAGYKIYRVANPQYNSAQFGTRFLDSYHRQGAADIGLTDAELEAKFCEPKNPNNSVPAGYDLVWNPGSHGPWKLMVYIPKTELGKYINTGSDASTYSYKWLDTSQEAQSGGTYWYYVAAFDNESGTIAGHSFTSLESGKDNFNGRWGEWLGTYPFATSALDFPTDAAGRKTMGAPFLLISENPADAKIKWTTNKLDFGRIRVGDRKDFSNELVISNLGMADLVIDSVIVPDGFRLSMLPKSFPVKVTPPAGTNPQLVLAVSFQPLKVGDFAGNLSIYHSDADTPVLSIALSAQASQISNTVVEANRWYQFGLAGRACSIQGNIFNQGTLYVYNTGESGYFVSYDGGGNWEFQSVVRPDSAEIFFHDYLVNTASNFNEKLFFDPTMHGRLYYEYIYQTKKSGTSILKNKTFRSDDNGISWIEIFIGHVRVNIGSYSSRIVVDPKNYSKVYRCFQNSIAFSGDRGNSWIDLKPGMNGDILIINPSNSNHLFYYSSSGITQSATGGLSWEPLQNLPGVCFQLAIDPINSNVLYGLFNSRENKLYKSYDSGLTWSEINNGINFNNVLQTNLIYPTLVINPQNNSEVFFGTRGGSPPTPQSIIYGTNNDGFSWKKLCDGWNKYSSHIDSLSVNSLLFENQADNRILYAATNDGIYKIVNPVTLVSEPQSEAIPNTFKLFQNYPNPFNPETVIRYQLPNPAKVTLKIYNLMGQEIRTLITEQKSAGYFTAYWDGKDDLSREVPSGVYIYRLQAKHFVSIKKMILLH